MGQVFQENLRIMEKTTKGNKNEHIFCFVTGTANFFKQWGGAEKKAEGCCELQGKIYKEYPVEKNAEIVLS